MSTVYNSYIVEHIDSTKKAYYWLRDHNIINLEIKEAEFLEQLNLHDLSKYSEEEYSAYDEYFYGTKTKKVKENFDYAWLHHIHENPHHWQHWILVNDDEGTYALEMPEEFVYEMICDWWSFSHKTGNLYEIFDWYKAHTKKMILHENTKKLVEEILDKIKKELDKDK